MQKAKVKELYIHVNKKHHKLVDLLDASKIEYDPEEIVTVPSPEDGYDLRKLKRLEKEEKERNEQAKQSRHL